jgi:MATE family multidrug resistance protein
MIVSQASETLMRFVDRLFLSWLGKVHLAASMSGGLSSFVFTALFAGIAGYSNALVAQYYGADRTERCTHTVSQGLYFSLFAIPALVGLIPLGHLMFQAAGHSGDQIALEFSYFRIMMLGAVLVLFRQVLVGFFLGIGRTRIVMLANLAGLIVNVPLNYVLIFGKLGLPALGIEGAAIATISGSFLIVVVLAGAYLRHPIYRAHRAPGLFRLRGELFGRLLRFGAPAGAELFLNVFAFNMFIQLMHSMGEGVAAAVTITFNYDMVAFVPMIGLGVAVTAMVGQQMGAGSTDGARKATMLALRVGYSYAAVMMALFVFGAGPLVRVFGGGLEAGDAGVLELARAMLRLAAIYTLADITQLVFSGALRGAGDTRAVMLISTVAHWVLAVAAVLLIRVFSISPFAMWIFFIGFVVVLGFAIFWRFRAGHWTRIRMIEREQLREETHRPEVAVEAEWM